MAWEKRRNGRLYYYRKTRIGPRVVSEYVGAGPDAHLIAELDESEREHRESERARHQAAREDMAAIDRLIAELDHTVRELLGTILRADGFHAHKRQWRRRRRGNTQEEAK